MAGQNWQSKIISPRNYNEGSAIAFKGINETENRLVAGTRKMCLRYVRL